MSLTNLGIGFAGSDTQSYTPTFTGLGTVTGISVSYTRRGDRLLISGSFTTGTVAASIASISLPAGLSLDSTKLSGSAQPQNVGLLQRTVGGAGFQTTTLNVLASPGSSSTALYFAPVSGGSPSTNALTPQNGNSYFGSSEVSTFWAEVPIASWSSNISIGMSSTYRISSYLANGTRVTTTPTALGQYRTRYKNTSALVDTIPTAPSAANGMQIYANVAGNAATGTSGQPTVVDVFIGKFKNFRAEFYSGTGFSGQVNTPYFSVGVNDIGVLTAYDPSTGVLTIDGNFTWSSSNTFRALGYTPAGSSVASGYFDVIVSENALAVGIAAPRSEVDCNGGGGFGSTATAIPRFTGLTTTGTAITYNPNNDEATNGASFRINEDGIYALSYQDNTSVTAGNGGFGFSKNSVQLTTGPGALTDGSLLMWRNNTGTNNIDSVHWTGILKAGDVVRPHTYGTARGNSAAASVRFTITKVSN